MKIPNKRRKGFSQTTDILLILTTTLAVGGIMYGIATGLITGMGSIPSLQVAGVGINVGTGGSTFTISLKNSGNTVLSGTATVVVAGVTLTGIGTPFGGDTHDASVTWTCPATGSTCTSSTVTLKPGDTLGLSFNAAASDFTTGNTYSINGGVGSEPFSTSTVATSA